MIFHPLSMPIIRASPLHPGQRSSRRKEQLSYQGFLAELLLVECEDRDRAPLDPAGQSRELSPGQNGSGTSILTRTRTSTPPPSTPSRPWTGSPKAHPLASSETPEPANPTCSSDWAPPKSSPKPSPAMGRVDLLCIDEPGYMELDRSGAELLFQVLTELEKKNSICDRKQRVVTSRGVKPPAHQPAGKASEAICSMRVGGRCRRGGRSRCRFR